MKIMTNVCVGNLCHVVLALNTFIIISHDDNENHVQYIEYGSRKYIKEAFVPTILKGSFIYQCS